MATTPSTKTTAAKRQAKRPAAKRTTAKRTTAKRTTARKATATPKVAAPTSATERAAGYAERAAHVQVGAVLTARDQVVELASDLVGRVSTRESAEKELKKLEKRGAAAQTRARR